MSDFTADGPVFGEERRQRILGIVQTEGRARVRDLAVLIGVTETTIRKDIADLDRARLVRRIHGGALAVEEPDVADRTDRNLTAKRAIARACLELIGDGDAIFLDSGTTIAEIADALVAPALALDGTRQPSNVNVLTNSLPVAGTLARSTNVRHTVLGGQFRPLGGCFVGSLALEALDRFSVSTAFIGVTGITDTGITCADTAEAQVKIAAISRSRRVVAPLDSSKVGVSDFVRVADLSVIDVVVTDRPSDELSALAAEAEFSVVIAHP